MDIAYERFRDPLPNVDYHIGSFSDPIILAESLKGMDIVYHLGRNYFQNTDTLQLTILDIHRC